MKRLFPTAAAITVLTGVFLLAAGEGARAADDSVVVHAVSIERNLDEGTLVGEGAVDMTYGDMRLRADRVVVNEETRIVIADGNVILDERESRLQGEHLELDLDQRTGFVEDGIGFSEPYFFSGRRLEKLGPDRYRVVSGSFTTCEGDEIPDWKFTSPDSRLQVEHYVTMQHPMMWVKKMPVFYLPYAAFPVKTERATGLLVPEIQVNEIDGWVVKNAFFWAPRDNFDATIGLDWYQNLGWGPGLEVRYITAPGTSGELESFYIDEGDGGESWNLIYGHQHALPYGVRGQLDLFFQSDRDYVRRFEDELEAQSMEKTTSSFSLSRSWNYYDAVFSGVFEESLLTARESSISRFPELRVSRTTSSFGTTGLFWNMRFEGVRLKSENVENIFSTGTGSEDEVLLSQKNVIETTRLDLLPEVSYPKALGSWGSITPAFSYRSTWYSEDLDGESQARLIPVASLSLEGPRVYRIFDFQEPKRSVEKVKHLIEPRVSYVYTPETEQGTIPQFDSIDFIGRQNTLSYSLTNTFLGKKVEDPVSRRFQTIELTRLKLLQSYDFNAEERPFTPMEWDVQVNPNNRWDLRWKGNWDVYESEVGYQDLSLTWRSDGGMMLSGEWRTSSAGNLDFLDLWAQIPMGPLFWDLRSRYNLDADEFIERELSLKYTSQCWYVSLGYIAWPEEWEYRIQIGLKEIGTILSYEAAK